MYSMDVLRACEILDIDINDPKWEDHVKRQYHIKALLYHPDKNKADDAAEKFRQVNEAYVFLTDHSAWGNGNSYDSNDPPRVFNPSFELVVRFFTNSLDENLKQQLIHQLLSKILLVCEHQAKQTIESMDYYQFSKIYKILLKYKAIFHLSSDFYDFMEKRNIYWFSQGNLKKRQSKDICIGERIYDSDELDPTKTYEKQSEYDWNLYYYVEVEPAKHTKHNEQTMVIRPTLDDVFVDNVFKCKHDGQDFLIPLWHHELVYQCNNYDLVVQVVPKMPSSNYWIDDDNHLHQEVEYTLFELWDCVADDKCMEIYFGRKRFVFYPNRLFLKPEQTWVWEKEGISQINMTNIYDISTRSNVILHIKISGVM